MSVYSDLVVADGPNAYWQLNESSGTDAAPTVGPYHGTYSGVLLAEPSLLPSDPSPSVYFDGTSAFISTGSACGMTVPMTVEFWIKPDQDATNGTFDSAPNMGNVIRNYSGDMFDWWGCSVSYNFVKDTTYHVAVVCSFSGSYRVLTVYVNGNQVGTNTLLGTDAAITAWRFGDINYGNAGRYKGWMQHLALYKKALAPARVLAHYEAGLPNLFRQTVVPLEIPGGIGSYKHVPLFFEGEHELYSGMFGGQFEYVGWLPTESKDVPIENWHQMWLWSCDDLLWSVDLGWNARVGKLPFGAAGWLYRNRQALFEAGGLTALLHSWNALQVTTSVLSHIWTVATELTTGSLDHSWDVLTEAGGDLPHLWRVAEPKLVILHGQDIQLPYGRVETP